MPDWMRALFGDVTVRELVLAAVVFGLILLFSWAPRIGEAIGGAGESDQSDRDDPG